MPMMFILEFSFAIMPIFATILGFAISKMNNTIIKKILSVLVILIVCIVAYARIVVIL